MSSPKITEVDLSPEQNWGIVKEIIEEGVGEETPTLGCEVEVLMRDALSDLDLELKKFILGKGNIVKACEIGISSMKKGEKAIIMCKQRYAHLTSEPQNLKFYDTGPDVEGTDLDLLRKIFWVELINWQYEDISPKKDGGIRKITITPGEGSERPNKGAEVEIHLIGKFNEKIFDERRNICFHRGQGVDYDIIKGVDLALRKFKKGETSRLLLMPQYAFGEEGSEKFGIPPNAKIEYEVTLVGFTKDKDIWLMSEDEKVEEAKVLKEKGNLYFQNGKLQTAITMYKRVIEMLKLSDEGRHIKEEDLECASIFFGTHMNLCLCYLKTENYSKAKGSINVALKLHPDNEKVQFRAGKVFFALGEYQSAIEAYEKCLKINPDNKAAIAEVKNSSNALQEHFKQERKIYGQMFERFAEVDTQREKIELKKMLNVMSSVGEWGAEDREREPSEFEKENPDIILLNKTGEFKDM